MGRRRIVVRIFSAKANLYLTLLLSQCNVVMTAIRCDNITARKDRESMPQKPRRITTRMNEDLSNRVRAFLYRTGQRDTDLQDVVDEAVERWLKDAREARKAA